MKNDSMEKQHLIQAYQRVRNKTKSLCQPLAVEDYVIQTMADVSPPKWHLAHTTWFFESFILAKKKEYHPFHPLFSYLFNSYYHGVGKPYPRDQRGLLSRPTVEMIYQYREHVDNHLIHFLETLSEEAFADISSTLTLGIHHEQQHQELLLMDIKHNFFLDPAFPIYQENKSHHSAKITPCEFIFQEGSTVSIGNDGNQFCFDNELPRHQYILNPYFMAARLVTNAEYFEFIKADGYHDPRWWLSDGWSCIKKNNWQAPLYWEQRDNKWFYFTLSGLKELDLSVPVSHVSYYEADAYARWRGKRLPTEMEWEYFATQQKSLTARGNFLENEMYHPNAPQNIKEPQQLLGDVWEWTMSAYSPYPGFKPLDGALSEYNGKFMSNQLVLRGGCCITPESHIRATYRNFFQPDKRWQFSGIRLADDGD